MSSPGPRSCIKTSRLVKLVAFALTALLSSRLSSQTVGQTTSIAVPEITESWAKTVVPVERLAHASVLIKGHDDQEEHESAVRQTTRPATAHGGRQTLRHVNSENVIARDQQSSSNSIVGTVFNVPFGGNPPDPMIAAGPDHLVVVVNSLFAIYNKSGTLISQTSFSDFFGSFNIAACCFDPRIVYDQVHQIFVFVAAEKGAQAGDAHVFVAVSQTADPTGKWNKFVLDQSQNGTWPDFPGLGISDSAVFMGNDQLPFNTGTADAWITVIPTSDLLAGSSTLNITRFKNVKTGSGALAFGIEPAITYGSSSLEFLVANPDGNSIPLFAINTVGMPMLTVVNVPVAPFQGPPQATQPGTTSTIPPGANVLSPVWRNNSLWLTQGVADSSGQNPVVRWYELDTTSRSVKQFGTEAGLGEAYYGALTVRPDGGVDLVYSTSSASQFVSAGYAHRDLTDPPNTMPVSGIYKAGDATFLSSSFGDLFGMSPDPSGAGTWGIVELAGTGGANHATAVVNLLASPALAAPDFSLTAPQTLSVQAGASSDEQVGVVAANGFSDVISFAVSGLPTGASVAFAPSTVTGGGSTTMTVTTTASVAPGNYPLTITGSSTGQAGNLSHSANVALVVAQPAPDFTIAPVSPSLSVQTGSSIATQIAIAALNGFTGTVSFNVLGLPSGATANFNPPAVTGSGSTKLTIAADSSTPVGQYPLSITASSSGPNGNLTHSVALTVTVTAAPAGNPDFAISATPPAATVHAGETATYSLAATAQSGFTGAVTLACAGLPALATCTFTPNPLTVTSAGGTSTLQIATTGVIAAMSKETFGSHGVIGLASLGFCLFGICFVEGASRYKGLLLAALLAIVMFGVGCGTVNNHSQQSGAGGSPVSVTPSGTYNVTITAASGSLQHSTSVQLVVQ